MFAGSVSDAECLQGMLHRSHLESLVQARLQACSTVARAAACLQDLFQMQMPAGLQALVQHWMRLIHSFFSFMSLILACDRYSLNQYFIFISV